ncbi:MAG: alpha/beta hydrolase [Aggregatilineales bacterium]
MTWTTYTSLLEDIKIHYLRNGQHDDRQTVILLHGITDSGACFKRVGALLSATYDVIMPDCRGHGESDAPKTGYELSYFADDIVRLITALGVYHPIIIGHSMGAETASVIASTGQSFVKALVLEDPPFRAKKPTPHQITATVNWWENSIIQQKKRSFASLIEEAQTQFRWSEEDSTTWADSKRKASPHLTEYIRNQPEHEWRETLKQVKCPALLLTGDVEGKGAIMTGEISEEVKTLMPTAEIVNIPNAGHSIRRDQFEAYINAVMIFLKKLA